MISKPNEGESRKPSRLRFFLRLVLTVFVVGYCIFLNCKRCSVTAFADSYVLDPQAALGLFGTEISGVYYKQSNNTTQNFTMHFAGYYSSNYPTYSSDSRLFPLSGGGSWDDVINILWWYPRTPSTDVSSSVSSETYLIYLWPHGSLLGGDFQTSSQISPYPNVTLDIDFGINFNAYSFDTNILFGRSPDARDSGWSSARILGSVPTVYNQMYPSGDGYGYSINTPYPAYVDGETEAMQLGCIPCAYPARGNPVSTLYTYTGIQCRLNGCAAPWQDTFVIYIQCPTIVSDNPVITTVPVTSTAPPTTRPPYTGDGVTTPLYTYDLSPIETNQQNQIRIQNENLQYVAGIFEGMNIIIGQLHDIYNKMVANGEIAVDLLPGSEWQIDSGVNAFVQNHITFTVASMNWQEVYKPVTGFYNLLDQYTFLDSFAVLGGIALAFGVFCWFIFKGRGG